MNKKLVTLIVLLVAAGGVAGYELRGNNNISTNAPSSTQTIDTSNTANYSGQGLTSFPEGILNDTSITVLNLSDNNLTGALPSQIQKLQKLQILDVSNNLMTGIPAEIGQLKSLKTLNYANNQITGLPNELGNLTKLEVLDLRGNPNVSQHDLAGIKVKLVNTQIKL